MWKKKRHLAWYKRPIQTFSLGVAYWRQIRMKRKKKQSAQMYIKNNDNLLKADLYVAWSLFFFRCHMTKSACVCLCDSLSTCQIWLITLLNGLLIVFQMPCKSIDVPITKNGRDGEGKPADELCLYDIIRVGFLFNLIAVIFVDFIAIFRLILVPFFLRNVFLPFRKKSTPSIECHHSKAMEMK